MWWRQWPDTLPSELSGLWDTRSLAIANVTIEVPNGEMYFLVENVDPNTIDATFYIIGDQNCLESDTGTLTYIGNNQYTDGSLDPATLVVNGNNLSMRLMDEESTKNIQMERTNGISVSDLPVCTTQSNQTDDRLFNDGSQDEPTKRFFSTIMDAGLTL